ncbi:hypothetical protein ABZ671_00605 [Micromonospora sp. NPDC006766]|uniref:hypothetical protein n=1 Tax=Micromonospora sp. NPDC006766 TaxID=3154778 RepID=UPI0033F54179
MGWGRMDDGFDDHPKVVAMLDRDDPMVAGFAIGLWTLAWTWAHRNTRKKGKTPGLIPPGLPRRWFGPAFREGAEILVAHGLWDEHESGGWMIHDFADYLPTEGTREARSEAGKRGAAARWGKRDDVEDVRSVPELDGNLPSVCHDDDGNGEASDGSHAPARRDPTPTPTPTPEEEPTPPAPAKPAAGNHLNPHPAVPGWLTDQKPTRPAKGTQPGLFGTAEVRLTERQEIIDGWLRLNGYPADTPFVKAVAKLAQQAFPGKPTNYFRGIAGPDGSGFGTFAEQVRKEHGETTDAAIRKLEATEPACEHGTLAGRAPHPTHKHLICPRCRAGIPAPADEPTTHPDVAAALAAYRAGWSGPPLATTALLVVTQQAEALRAAGVPAAQLADLAHTAAKTGVGLLAAATRKDHAA